jgi:putative endonuclease
LHPDLPEKKNRLLLRSEKAERIQGKAKTMKIYVTFGVCPLDRSCFVASWHLYIVRTVDQFLYAGISTDVQRRFKEHLAQGRKAAKYLLAHKPQKLAFSIAIGDRALAAKVEYYFKRLSKKEKEWIVGSQELVFDEESGRIRTPGKSFFESTH